MKLQTVMTLVMNAIASIHLVNNHKPNKSMESMYDAKLGNIFVKSISSRFLAILGCNTTCTDRHAKKGMDTAAHTGDGFQDIIIVG